MSVIKANPAELKGPTPRAAPDQGPQPPSPAAPRHQAAVDAYLDLASASLSQPEAAIKDGALVHALYQALNPGLWGLGNDSVPFSQLLWKSPEQLERMRALFHLSYQKELERAVQSEVGGAQRAVLQAILVGDSPQAAARLLQQALEDRSLPRVAEVLRSAPSDEARAQVLQAYRSLYGEGLEVGARALGYFEVQQVKALMAGSVALQGAWEAREVIRSRKDPRALLDRVQRLGPALFEAYRQQFQADLLDDVARGLGEATAKDVRAAALVPEVLHPSLSWSAWVKASPSEKVLALDYAVRLLPRAARRAWLQAVEQVYADPSLALLPEGEPLPDAEAMERELSQRPLVEERILARLASLSATAIAELSADYRQRYGRTLSQALSGALAGDAWVAAQLALEGKPETVAAHLARVDQLHEVERRGVVNLFSRTLLDEVLRSAKGPQFDQAVERLRAMYERAMADGTLTDGEALALAWVVDAALSHSEGYAKARAKVRQHLRNAVTALVLGSTTGGFANTSGLSQMLVSALGRGAVGGTASAVGGMLMDGGTSSAAARAQDVRHGFAQGVATGVASELRNPGTGVHLYYDRRLRELLGQVVPNLVAETLEETLEGRAQQRPWSASLRKALGDSLMGLMAQAAAGVVWSTADRLASWVESMKESAAGRGLGPGRLILELENGQRVEVQYEGAPIEPWRVAFASRSLERLTQELKVSGIPNLKKIHFQPPDEEAIGWYHTGTREIHLAPSAHYGNKVFLPVIDVLTKMEATTTHEIAHLLHYVRGRHHSLLIAATDHLFGRGASVSRYALTDAEEDMAETFEFLVHHFDLVTSDLERNVYDNGDVGRKLHVLLRTFFPHVPVKEVPLPTPPLGQPFYDRTATQLVDGTPGPVRMWPSLKTTLAEERPVQQVTSGAALFRTHRDGGGM